MSERRIGELAKIEFDGAKDFTTYSRTLRDLCRDMVMETEAAAEEVIGVLSRQNGHPLLFGLDVRIRARRVANRLRRAAELFEGAGVEAVKFRAEFRYQFANVINPPKTAARRFDWDDD